ncbi:hypothetical protein VTL71DRAFT_13520 [Oculimacula yallundae]|uniref:Uncharacterized protein n=1 Tax=Oculimacula yallundae TaxID=86028 RepID=A0ABR4CKP6_9HELO
MTSRKKIFALTKAAKNLSCSVILKTGSPPGVMLAEGELAGDWLEVVRKLRYKDFRLMKKEVVQRRGLLVEPGHVRELSSVKDFGALLEGNGEIFEWWRVGERLEKVAGPRTLEDRLHQGGYSNYSR